MVLKDEELTSPWRPFQNYTTLCLGVWASAHNISRAVLQDLFDIQRRIHVSQDGSQHAYNPHDLPMSAEHFVANFRRVLPRLKVYEYDVPGKIDAETGRPSLVPVVSFAANEVLARNLRSPRAVASMLANPGGQIMSGSSCEANRIVDPHVLPVPTRRADGTMSENLHGLHCRRAADVGIESIRLSNGEEVFVGDTVMADTGSGPGEGAPHRLAGLYFQQTKPGGQDAAHSPDSPSEDNPGHIRVELRPFRTADAVVRGGNIRRGAITRVWEDVTEAAIQTVGVLAIKRLCTVIPDTAAPPQSGLTLTGNPTFMGAGFAEASRIPPTAPARLRAVRVPWTPAGVNGKSLVMRSPSVHRNEKRRDVVKVPLWLYSDAFNVFSEGGTLFPVNGTYWGLTCLSQSQQRRLDQAFVACLAHTGAQWQHEHGATAKIIGRIRRGCSALLAEGNGSFREVSTLAL